MSNRKGFAAVAACAALSCAGLVKADDATSYQPDSFSLVKPSYLQAAPAPAPRRPLMYALDKSGAAKSLDDVGINIYGHLEASYTIVDPNPGPGGFIPGRVFDVDNQDVTLNQIQLVVQRSVDAAKAAKDGKVDVGFTLDTMYGGDARFIHSSGMNFYGHGDFGQDSVQLNPDEQLDVTQAFVDVAVPVGNGMLIRAGKMVTHMGFETINPEGNALYSHSYLFGFAIPFTNTGVNVYYNLNDKLTVMGGISRGWNQSLTDNNGDSIDMLYQAVYKASDTMTLIYNGTLGPEAAGNSSDWWWVNDFVLSQKIGDQLTIAVNADYGLFIHGDPVGNGKSAQWYGVAAYAGYTLNDMLTLNSRAEWYNDQEGANLGGGTPITAYEVTVGLAVKPMPNHEIGRNLIIRPELRYDYTQPSGFNGGTDHDMISFGVDVLFLF